MKQTILQKLAVAFILCFLFQDTQAQELDEGKFPNRFLPMIDNIVIFNHTLKDYIASIDASSYAAIANISDESGNYNPNQTENDILIIEEVAIVEIKEVEVNKIQEEEVALDAVIPEHEEQTQHIVHRNQQNTHFGADVLAELVSAYPNPVQNTLIVEAKENLLLDIQLFNSLGQLIYAQKSVGIGKVQIDVQNFAKGTYFLNIVSDTKRVVEKIQIVK